LKSKVLGAGPPDPLPDDDKAEMLLRARAAQCCALIYAGLSPLIYGLKQIIANSYYLKTSDYYSNSSLRGGRSFLGHQWNPEFGGSGRCADPHPRVGRHGRHSATRSRATRPIVLRFRIGRSLRVFKSCSREIFWPRDLLNTRYRMAGAKPNWAPKSRIPPNL